MIDLDLARVVPGTPPPRRSPRTAVRAVVLLLALCTLTGSVRVPPGLDLVFTLPPGSRGFQLSSSAVYVLAATGASGDESQIRRHSLTDGSATWTTVVPQTPEEITSAEAARVLILTSRMQEIPRYSFVDSDTGQVLWRLAESGTWITQVTGDGVLLTEHPAGGPVLRMADLRTGSTIWSRPVGESDLVSAGTGHVVVIGTDNRVTVIGVTDGSELATAALTSPAAGVDQIGDRLYVTSRAGGADSITALRLPELTELWRNERLPPGMISGCGPDVCVADDLGTALLDGTTGEQRWSVREWVPEYTLVQDPLPGPGALAVHVFAEVPRQGLLDPATGRLLTETGRLSVAGRLLVRTDTRIPGRTWIQAARPEGGLRTVASLTGVTAARCTATGEHLVCPTDGGELRVWRTPG
ncbi:PQQ-binding-like beta-propeller repeat protein [Actinoplanes sp. NPDC051494]|uniref:outer membrane protein assembly factor BamB family protein n=1 Tax=Actinoplanes sp. NPDC051494 TaxID=3363907 RepID=UPI0037B87E48